MVVGHRNDVALVDVSGHRGTRRRVRPRLRSWRGGVPHNLHRTSICNG